MDRQVNYSAPTNVAELPPELEELKLLARDVVEKECFPLEQQFLEGDARNSDQDEVLSLGAHRLQEGALPATEWRRLRKISQDAGLYSVEVPGKYGGTDLGVFGAFVVAEEVNRSVVHLPTAKVPGALYEATEEQKDKYLYPLLSGQKRYAFAQTESESGSDPASMSTTAVKKGGEWEISGTKVFISGAAEADFFLLLALTDKEKRQRGGITLFLVDADLPGISMSPIGTWLTATPYSYTVHFDAVRVSDDAILGGLGNGFQLGQGWLAIHDRLSRGAMACGILSRGLEMATEWAKSRSSFGAPLADRQAIQWMLVDILVDLKAIRAISYECAARADMGDDVRELAAMAKFVGGNWGFRSIDKIMQIFGGMGESYELPIVNWYRNLRHARIGGGTDEIQRIIMSRAIFRKGSSLWLA